MTNAMLDGGDEMTNDNNDLIRRGDAVKAAYEAAVSDLTHYAPNTTPLRRQLMRRAVSNAIRALPAVTVGVKPLVWADRIGRVVCEADTVIGVYHIGRDGAWIALWFDGSRISGALPSIEAAKAAAQRDYEARILAALEPQPVQPNTDAQAIREAALREAIETVSGVDLSCTLAPKAKILAAILALIGVTK